MPRDRALIEECHALQRAVVPCATLTALRASPEWPALAVRLARLLGTVRRHAPPNALPPAPGDRPMRVVHWNVEHGNRYDAVESALLTHDQLRDADLVALNEVDLGMARSGNRDVAGDLAAQLGLHGVWAPLFLETTAGRDDDVALAGLEPNDESLFGLAMLSRWPIGEARIVELPSPEDSQFDLERMVGRHIGLTAEILRPGAPFVAVTAHLEVHRTRAHRAAQMDVLLRALESERRPVFLSGDFNSSTFDRGLAHSGMSAAWDLFTTPSAALRARLLRPDRGPHAEPLFELLRAHGFEWESRTDFAPTLQLRFDRVHEARAFDLMRRVVRPLVDWAVARGTLRLDWLAGRGWTRGAGGTIGGLGGRGRPSDHAPIWATFG